MQFDSSPFGEWISMAANSYGVGRRFRGAAYSRMETWARRQGDGMRIAEKRRGSTSVLGGKRGADAVAQCLQLGATVEEGGVACERLLHEQIAPFTQHPGIAVLAEKVCKDVLLHGNVTANLSPRPIEFFDVAREQPDLDFFYGSAGDQPWAMLQFEMPEPPGAVPSIIIYEE
jgi:hypothetical protein